MVARVGDYADRLYESDLTLTRDAFLPLPHANFLSAVIFDSFTERVLLGRRKLTTSQLRHIGSFGLPLVQISNGARDAFSGMDDMTSQYQPYNRTIMHLGSDTNHGGTKAVEELFLHHLGITGDAFESGLFRAKAQLIGRTHPTEVVDPSSNSTELVRVFTTLVNITDGLELIPKHTFSYDLSWYPSDVIENWYAYADLRVANTLQNNPSVHTLGSLSFQAAQVCTSVVQ